MRRSHASRLLVGADEEVDEAMGTEQQTSCGAKSVKASRSTAGALVEKKWAAVLFA